MHTRAVDRGARAVERADARQRRYERRGRTDIRHLDDGHAGPALLDVRHEPLVHRGVEVEAAGAFPEEQQRAAFPGPLDDGPSRPFGCPCRAIGG